MNFMGAVVQETYNETFPKEPEGFMGNVIVWISVDKAYQTSAYQIGRNSTVSPIAAAILYSVATVGTVNPRSILEI